MRTTKDKRKAQLNDASRQIAAGRHAEAEAILSGLLSTYPGDPEVCRRLATLHLKRGQLQVALSEIKFLATAAMRAQDYALAEAMIREYLQVDNKAVQLLDLLGQVYEEKGDRPAATEQYGRALELLMSRPDPELPDLPAELYQKIKALSPNHALIRRFAQAFTSGSAPEVQYAAPRSVEIVRTPKVGSNSSNGTEELPAPVVSLESDEDFRNLVSPAPQMAAAVSSEDIVVPKVEPTSDSTPLRFVQSEAPVEAPLVAAEAAIAPVEAYAAETEAPPSYEQVEAPEAVTPLANVLQVSEPSAVSEPSLERTVTETAISERIIEPPVEAAPPAAQWKPYTEQEPELQAEPEPVGVQGSASAVALSEYADQEPERRPRSVKPKRRPAVDYKAIYMRSRLSRWVRQTVAAVRFTGQLIMWLVALSVIVPILTVGAIAVIWLALEQKPTAMFQTLSTTPAQSMPDPKRNGYFLLLGLGEPAGLDPMKAGYDRWQRVETQRPRCVDTADGEELTIAADTRTLASWFLQPLPTSRFMERRATVAAWQGTNELVLNRYEQWLTMPFEDVGYSTFTAPHCGQVLAVHRLYLSAGFGEGIMAGIPRLELDLAAWRNVLAHARTLTMKLLAVRMIDEDVHVLSDLLARPDLDSRVLPRLTRLARPLEANEQSLRYPMHDEFLAEVKQRERGLMTETGLTRPWSIHALTWMPLPKQRALNTHAAYYDAAMRASETNLTGLPTVYEFARTPARRFMDYLTNPVDNLVQLDGIPAWRDYAADILEVDARLRLAGLQARLRVPARDGSLNLLGRIAEAGPAYFDPFTGLPMLTNATKTVLYSIGRDRTDNNADARQDLTVPIFSAAPAL